MSLARTWASRLLGAVRRHASPGSREWASAMRRELDFIENDWAALFWALGCASAVFRHSVPRAWRAWLEKRANREPGPVLAIIRKNAAGTLWGVTIAVAVLAGAFALVRQLFVLFPTSDLKRVEWAEVLAVIVVPEAIFIAAALALWRRRRSLAVGMAVSAFALGAHVVVHLMTH